MGRLFWKFFFAFWGASVATGLAIALALWLAESIGQADMRQLGLPPGPLTPVIAGALVSLAFSTLAAWYLSKPIRHLRWALHQVAEGHLDVRVQPLMGHRRDDVADLGRDFDRMAQQLQQSLAAHKRLLHDVSHELRSPLARLQAAIGLARQNPQKLEPMLERIEREAERVDRLVGELLTLARLESADMSPPRERVDLIELLGAIADDAQFEARASGRDVLLRADASFVAEVGAELIYRAFENVIRNAVKYTREGSAVEIEARVVADGAALEVAVGDRGPGVPQAALQAIFEPFQRLAVEQPIAGFGLGLAIARRAIESHGGSIQACQRDGGGLLMYIRLPADAGAEASTEAGRRDPRPLYG